MCVCVGVYMCVPHAYRSLGKSEEIVDSVELKL